MSIKKTIGISVIFHLILFSAALLFSAGLFKGSGNNPDEKVFFVNLAVENSQVDNKALVLNKKTTARRKIPAEKQTNKHQVVAEKPPETVKTEVALEKAAEPVEEKIVENDEPLQDNPYKAQTDEEPVMDETLDIYETQKETVHAALLTPVESKGLRNGSARSGLTPSMIDLIGNAIEKAKSYPMLARRRGLEGTVHVSFRINDSGEPDEIEIKKSSGHSILDSATVKVVKKAAPYPHTNSRVEVPVAYSLRK